MGSVLLTVFAVLAIVTADVAALKCYTCVGVGDDACSKEKLEENQEKYLTDCTSAADRCFRQESEVHDVTVATGCSTRNSCETVQSKCDEQTAGYEDCKDFVCCNTDKCNGGSAVSFSVFLMAICCAVGLVLVK